MRLKTLLLSTALFFCFAGVNDIVAQEGLAQPLPEVPKGSVADKIKDRSFDDTQVLLKNKFTGWAMIHKRGWGLLFRLA